MIETPLVTVLADAARALDEAGFEHALIGGLGAIAYGSTRMTKDVDLAVAGDRDGVRNAMERAGFRDLAMRGEVLQGAHDVGRRADFLLACSSFEAAVIEGARLRPVLRIGTFRVARVEDIVAWKLVAGRPRDLRDIEELAEKNPDLDLGRLGYMLGLVDVAFDPERWRSAAAEDDLRLYLRELARAIRS